jgi:phenylalanyl-tRNA synthetase beta chain
MIKYFEAVDLKYDAEKNVVVVPTWRQDVLRTCDLAEEVARFSGYDKIPTTLPQGAATAGKLQFDQRVLALARDVAEDCGFNQAYCYSFESPKVFDKLRLDADDVLRKAIEIANPLGEDFSVMRTTSLNGILTSLATNYNRRNKSVRLYEQGNIYLPKALPLTELPDERMQFTFAMYGEGDFFDLKGVVELLLSKMGMDKKAAYKTDVKKNYMHPGRQAQIFYDGVRIGEIGEIHPLVAKTYGIGDRAYVAVIDMPTVYPYASFDRKFSGIAKYPAVSRDISMTVPHKVTAAEIEAILEQRGGKLLESYHLFDIYEGPGIMPGFKSVAYNLTFRHKDKTMEESEIVSAMNKILNGLGSIGATLRQ